MCPRKPARTFSAAVVAALLLCAAPAVVASPAETVPRAEGVWFPLDQILTTWWGELSGSVGRLFGRSWATVDPNGTASVPTASNPTAGEESWATVDPNG